MALTPTLIPWNPQADQRDRRHQQLVANLLNSLILQGVLIQTGFGWTITSTTSGSGGGGGSGVLPQRGADGNSWLTGHGAPSRLLGHVRDLYFDAISGNVYQKQAVSPFEVPKWVVLASLRGGKPGPTGAKGATGLPGLAGAPGIPGTNGLNGASGFDNGLANGRLTLTTLTPVTISNVTAATAVLWTPYRGAQIALFSSGVWTLRTFAEISVAVPSNTNTPFDVYASWNGSAVVLTAVTWSSATARSTGLSTQDGILCSSADATQKYLGTCCTTGVSGQCEDSLTKRFVWNWYNQICRRMLFEVVAAHSYTSATIRPFNNSAANSVQLVVGGLVSLPVNICCAGVIWNYGAVGVALDSTTTFAGVQTEYVGSTLDQTTSANYGMDVPIGQHTLNINESGAAGSHQNFAGIYIDTPI